jgi:hypothetical protein
MNEPNKKLLVLWTTANRETALNMVLMYTHNAKLKNWWDEVNLLLWGASQNFLLSDSEAKSKIAEMINDGVNIIACRKCAENLGVADQLKELGVTVFYTGEYLTDWLNSGHKMITV